MNALSFATAQILRVLPRAPLGRALGRMADHAWSPPLGRAVVGLYSRAYGVDFTECVQSEGWESFDAFFTRPLRDGARPVVGDPRVLVSPADGRVESLGRIDEESTFLIKGRPYRVEELVGDGGEAERYRGGCCCVVYLSPRDYHRVHAPVSGAVVQVRSLPGDYYPVNAVGMRHVKNLFVRNRRLAIAIDTPEGSGFGRVTVVMVAAMIVGRITVTGIDERDVPFGVHTFTAPRSVARGDELGAFHLGSTAVVLIEPSAMGRWLASEGPIRYGEPLASASVSNGVVHGAAGNGRRNGR